jgi:hypothetical protein
MGNFDDKSADCGLDAAAVCAIVALGRTKSPRSTRQALNM